FIHWMRQPFVLGMIESFERIFRAIPTGMFDSAPLASSLARLFAAPGRTNEFRKLKNKLFVVAAELDSSRSVPFGAPGHDDVSISRAVQASVSLPGYYPPVSINGHSYVDGVLNKTLHASVALAEGVKLLICINPLVPFDRALATEHHPKDYGPLLGYGLPLVMSQTFRAIIHSRMRTAFGRYAAEYPDADIVLFEPPTDDPEMFFVNVFSYADRKRLCEDAYQQTRRELRRRADTLEPILAKHGVALNRTTLDDANRTLAATVAAPAYSRLVSLFFKPFDHALARLEASLSPAEAGTSERSPP
ncbi:MAG: patatin-like phospholipase family protein, partial [Acetobacteraceae bacterium]|nr:patatin-like phospholipase family protein [Acetobacteraceae bacterium]